MKRIRDIRLVESGVPNTDGNRLPEQIGKIYPYDDMQCLDVIQRLLFLLRYRNFGFGDFSYLFLNFTPCLPHGEVQDAKRRKCWEEPEDHYVDVGCDPSRFAAWSLPEQTAFIVNSAKTAGLLKAPEELRQVFADTFEEVLENGAALQIPYKRKETADLIVEVFVRINDDLEFFPLVRVSDKSGVIKAERELRRYDRDEFISQISTITVGKTYVKIAPRKNWYTDFYGLKPIRLAW